MSPPSWVRLDHGGLVAELLGSRIDTLIVGTLFGALALAWWVATGIALTSTGPVAALCMTPMGLALLGLVGVAVRQLDGGHRVRLDPRAVTVERVRFGRIVQSQRLPLRDLQVSLRSLVDTAEATVVGLELADGASRFFLPQGSAKAHEVRWLAGVLEEAAEAARQQPAELPDAEAARRLEALLARGPDYSAI